MSEIGDYLKSLRLRRGLSLREVEKLADVSNAYLSMIESGKRPAPHPKVLKKLAVAYGEKLSKLMKIAGYLELSDTEEASLEVERLYQEAISDPTFAFGRRATGKMSTEMKRFVAEMYSELKAQRGKRKR